MLRLCIDAEILTVAAAVCLRLSVRIGMSDDSQRETCIQKTMKTHRKINVFRLDLSTDDPVSEEPIADASFYFNKTHILKIVSARTENVLREKIRNAAQRLRQQSPDFIISNAARFLYAKKNDTPLRRTACKFPLTKTRCLTKRNKFIAKNVQTVFLEPRDIGHDRWTLATLRFALGRASADRVATTTQIEKLRGVCPSRFVHARRPVQWPRQMGFSHIYIYIWNYSWTSMPG